MDAEPDLISSQRRLQIRAAFLFVIQSAGSGSVWIVMSFHCHPEQAFFAQ
jgi:hypothetical protein